MSLNGLDDPKVREAHATAVAEPGGWFLLKYASRDEVELLGRGNGGIVEIRKGIAEYEENSPLYGFLRYRRRNVIIKYLPEDCSRLIQARSTVHFNSLCDHFAPYDTIFSIADAKELKDTKLSAACSLHAASGSTGSNSSSTSSLRRRRLMEITEEEEEHREKKRQSIVKEEERPESSAGPQDSQPASVPTPGSPPSGSPPPVTLNSNLATSPEESQFAGTIDPPSFVGLPRPSSPTKSFDDGGRRNSSQSARNDLYAYPSYSYKPKVKLGPRPSLETSGRPRRSGSSENQRPVSSIPAGFKLSSKGSKRSHSQDKIIFEDGESPAIEEDIQEEGRDSVETNSLSASAPLPDSQTGQPAGCDSEVTGPHDSSEGGLPNASSAASLKSNLPIMGPPPAKANHISPEKARLMKAMKLREKKKLLSAQSTTTVQGADSPSEPPPPGPNPELSSEAEEIQVPAEEAELASADNADSAIVLDTAHDKASLDTRTDSHPTSPVVSSSDLDDSTKASSLSDSTDEATLPGRERKDSLSTEQDDEEDMIEPVPVDEEVKDDETSAAGLETGVSVPVPVSVPAPAVEEEQPQPTTANESEADAIKDQDVANAEQGGLLDTGMPNAADETSDESLVLPISQAAAPAAASAGSNEEQQIGTATAPLPNLAPSGVVDPAGPQHDAATLPSPGVISTPDSPQWKIPLSKFSTQESKSPTITSANPSSPIPLIIATSHDPDSEDREGDERTGSVADGPEAGEQPTERTPVECESEVDAARSKPTPAVEPIRTDLTASDRDRSQAESDISDDDELMEELQSATFQEAKPMTVSKSPVTAAFPAMSPKKTAAGLESGASPASTIARAASNPVRGNSLGPDDGPAGSTRSVSSGAAYLQKMTQQQAAADLRPKTAKIGSSISQRIKALQEQTAHGGGAGADVVTTKERPSSAFFSVRKNSVREPSRPSSVLERASSALKGTTPSPGDSRDHSPETGRLLAPRSMANRLSMFEPLTATSPRGRPESVQAKARIIRDPTQPTHPTSEPRSDPSDYSPLDPKQSPLVADLRQNTSPEPAFGESSAETLPEGRQSLLERRLSKGRRSQSRNRDDQATEEPNQRPRRRSSLTVVKDFIKETRDSLLPGRSPSTDNLGPLSPQSTGNLTTPSRSPSRPPSAHHNPLFPRRLSISSRRSSLDKNPGAQATMMEVSGESDVGSGELLSRPGSNGSVGALSVGPKNPNRATRFIRRLSNTIGPSRKNSSAPTISPTVTEEDDGQTAAQKAGQQVPASAAGAADSTAQSSATFMGDVNVQFPDTLLWKRRTMCLDSQGFLILSAVQGATAAKQVAGVIKRYHMSQFRLPYLPDMEVQELPNSIVLDFVDGSGLQVACEDRAGQMNTLHMLQHAHQNHTAFGV